MGLTATREMVHGRSVPIPKASSAGFYKSLTTFRERRRTRLAVRRLSSRIRDRLYAALETGQGHELNAADVASALVSALQLYDGVTGEHAERAQLLAERVALELELDPETVRATSHATALHDIGKICIPDYILNKPEKLNGSEWRIMRRHSEMGANILSRIGVCERVSLAVLTHHERYDGRGYPAGLSKEDIPVEARIISVVDAYDAITSDRPYRKARNPEEALQEIERNAGAQFCPAAAQALLDVVGRDRPAA